MDHFDQATRTNVDHAILVIFITEEVLKEAHDKVTSASEEEIEGESTFRVIEVKVYSRYHHVFTSTEIVIMYVIGLIPEIRDMVIKKTRLLRTEHKGSM